MFNTWYSNITNVVIWCYKLALQCLIHVVNALISLACVGSKENTTKKTKEQRRKNKRHNQQTLKHLYVVVCALNKELVSVLFGYQHSCQILPF